MPRTDSVTDLEAGVIGNSNWTHRWQTGDISFHQAKNDPFLDENEASMFEGKKKSAFVPLCGKSRDMVWMYQRGHTVCGVEVVEQPCIELFQDHCIPLEVETIENVGKLYKSKDGRLRIYCADLFNINKEMCGEFDIIWDHRSLIAINLTDHQQYRDLMTSVMKPDGKYYLATVEYDSAVWPGPPHSLSDSHVQNLFKTVCKVETLVENTTNNVNTAPKADTQKGADNPKTAPEADTQKGADNPTTQSTAFSAIAKSSFLSRRWYQISLN